jgi:hypothetical protein
MVDLSVKFSGLSIIVAREVVLPIYLVQLRFSDVQADKFIEPVSSKLLDIVLKYMYG